MGMKPGSRPVQVRWDTDPNTNQLFLVLLMPVQQQTIWTPAQRKRVAQIVTDAALHALHSTERDGVPQ